MDYKFKMEKILDYKNSVEKSRTEDYLKASHHLAKEKDELEQLTLAYDKQNQEKKGDLSQMKMQFLYKEKLKTALFHQEKKVEVLSTRVEDARGHLIEARKDRKIMENLKEKDRERYRMEILASEQKELDDLSIMKYAR